MKKYFLLALVVLTGIASSCKYDDDDLWENVNDLADRVSSLEAATKQMNSDIAAMQSIISALQNQVTVSKVEELKDGYIIHFSDGTKATIKNGADGKDGANGADGKDGVDGENGKDGKDGANAPIINVKQEGGVYYWTITVDGKTEWLTDEDGNKLRVSGEDGEDGKDGTSGSSGKNGNTPLLKVNAAGNWTVSYDNGATYTEVKDVNNQPVKAKGENGVNGDSKFTRINQSGDMLIIVFDGKTYEIPLAASVTYTGNAIVGDVVTLAPKTSVTLNYELPEMLNASVEVVKAPDFVAVEAGNGKLTIKAKSTATEPGKIVLLYYNANKTITSVLTVKVTTMVATAADLQAQLNAGGGMVTLTSDIELTESLTIPAGKTVTLDLNGCDITGEDNLNSSFGLINNNPESVLNVINVASETGSIILESKNNRGWNAYSSVISNQRGTLIVGEGVVIEHLGGTDMAYGIDNLTNTGSQNAITIIDGATVKSTYRAIRQFLNSEASGVKNELYVNSGTIQGNKNSIWMQNANAKANPGNLVVSKDATLKGNVLISYAGATTGDHISASIATSALKDNSEIVLSNAPSGYMVKNNDGVWTIISE